MKTFLFFNVFLLRYKAILFFTIEPAIYIMIQVCETGKIFSQSGIRRPRENSLSVLLAYNSHFLETNGPESRFVSF